MALPEIDGAFYPTETEIRDQLLRTIEVLFRRRGKTANVLPGSDYFITCTAVARVLAIAFANSKVSLRDVSPLTATGENLQKIARAFGVEPRPASIASGFLIVKCTGTVVIPAGHPGTAPNGKRYKTTSTVTVSNGQSVEVQSIDAGESANQPADTVIKWASASVGALASTATVAPGGLTGGSDGDTDATLRTRLLNRLANPAAGGNWPQIKAWAEESSAAIEAAYVYAAARGPGSVDVAITRAGGDRTLGATVVAQAGAYVKSRIPGYASVNVTSVAPQLVDVTVRARLALPTQAGGAGGGWLDTVPWPADDAVIAAVAGGQVDVTTSGTPVLGQHIGLWDPANQTMVEFTITALPVAIPGGWRFTIATSVGGLMPGWVAAGFYVSAGAEKLAEYGQSIVAQFEKLGPGEKTANLNILPRALRKPAPDVAAPSDLTSLLLAAVTNEHPEILSLDWGVRRVSGTTIPLSAPPVPVTTADPPYVLVLQHLAIRREP